MNVSRPRVLFAIAWLLSACGTAAPYDYELPNSTWPPIVSLRGHLTGDSADTDSNLLKAALVWFPVSPEKGKYQISQSAPSRQQGVFNMQIDIAQTPPELAIQPGADPNNPSMRYGQAELLIYEDRDDDNQLDLVPVDGGASRDRVVGRATGLRLWWLPADSSPAGVAKLGYEPVTTGLSVTVGPMTADPEPGDCFDPETRSRRLCGRMPKTSPKGVASTDSIPIELSSNPTLQSYTCLGFWGTSPQKSDEWPDYSPGWSSPALKKKLCDGPGCDCHGTGDGTNARSPDCALDLPSPGQDLVQDITCNTDNRGYVWKSCVHDPELCNTYFCHYGHGDLAPDETPPTGWPCPRAVAGP